MAELTETTKYITINEHGTPMLAESNINIVPLGVAHEAGMSEEALLEQYEISRAELHAALSYFYDHREAIRDYQAETERLMKKYGSSSRADLEALRTRK